MISIIDATHEHAGTIVDLGIKTFVETYGEFNTKADMELYLKDHYGTSTIIEELRHPETKYFLACYNEVPAGFAKLRNIKQPDLLPYTKNIEIERLYVLQPFQHLKIGKALIEHCLQAAAIEGYEVVWLGVWQQNENAIAFYEKFGFEKFGTQSFLLGKDLQTDWLLKYNLRKRESTGDRAAFQDSVQA